MGDPSGRAPWVILLVDDEPEVTRALARIIAQPDREVIALNDPYEAIELVERRRIDLVITDKDMPQMSGHMLLDVLRDGHTDIPCVFLTGTPSLDSTLTALNSQQVVRYLTKPYRPEEIRETVIAGLERRVQLLAASGRRAVDERRAHLREAIEAAYPGVLAVTTGEAQLASTFVSDSLDEIVQGHLENDTKLEAALPALLSTVGQARPVHIAEALVIVPLRRRTVGCLLLPDGVNTALCADVRGRTLTLALLDRARADAVAGRLAVMAGIDLASVEEQLGRISVRVPGAAGDVMIGYRATPLGAALEVRRVLTGADETGIQATPDHFDQYQVLSPLGEGGMGTVYRALHTVLQRPVAIKVLRGVQGSDPISVARFLREARSASRARHPRIVETLDFGHLPDGRPYLVMELVEAKLLSQRMKEGPFDLLSAVLIAQGVAEALVAAHAADVVHRDVKPANIFVDDQLEVKLADFGAAKVLSDVDDGLTRSGMTLGTPLYMAPEQITGREVDGRTDVYALGCVLFHMVVGTPPYLGKETRSVLAQHVNADVPALSSPRGPVPELLVALARRAMAKDPRQRFESAEQLMAQLGHASAVLARQVT